MADKSVQITHKHIYWGKFLFIWRIFLKLDFFMSFNSIWEVFVPNSGSVVFHNKFAYTAGKFECVQPRWRLILEQNIYAFIAQSNGWVNFLWLLRFTQNWSKFYCSNWDEKLICICSLSFFCIFLTDDDNSLWVLNVFILCSTSMPQKSNIKHILCTKCYVNCILLVRNSTNFWLNFSVKWYLKMLVFTIFDMTFS